MKQPYVNCAVFICSVGLTIFFYGPTPVLGAAVEGSSENDHRRDGPPVNDESELVYHDAATGNATQHSHDTVPNVPNPNPTASVDRNSVIREDNVTSLSRTTVPTTTAVTVPVAAPGTNCTDGACGGNTGVGGSVSLTATTKKVKIEVIYESHCPYSRRFIYSQLYPTYKLLQDYLDVKLVPYGKANTWNETDKEGHKVPKFSCQHGPNECVGNKIEACTVKIVKETLVAIQIIACMSESFVPHKAAKECVEATSIKWSLIEACFNNDGDVLLYEMAKETWKVKAHVDRVPLVVVDGQMDNYVEVMAQKDLLALTCDEMGPTTNATATACVSRRR